MYQQQQAAMQAQYQQQQAYEDYMRQQQMMYAQQQAQQQPQQPIQAQPTGFGANNPFAAFAAPPPSSSPAPPPQQQQPQQTGFESSFQPAPAPAPAPAPEPQQPQRTGGGGARFKATGDDKHGELARMLAAGARTASTRLARRRVARARVAAEDGAGTGPDAAAANGARKAAQPVWERHGQLPGADAVQPADGVRAAATATAAAAKAGCASRPLLPLVCGLTIGQLLTLAPLPQNEQPFFSI